MASRQGEELAERRKEREDRARFHCGDLSEQSFRNTFGLSVTSLERCAGFTCVVSDTQKQTVTKGDVEQGCIRRQKREEEHTRSLASSRTWHRAATSACVFCLRYKSLCAAPHFANPTRCVLKIVISSSCNVFAYLYPTAGFLGFFIDRGSDRPRVSLSSLVDRAARNHGERSRQGEDLLVHLHTRAGKAIQKARRAAAGFFAVAPLSLLRTAAATAAAAAAAAARRCSANVCGRRRSN